jgi:hypothetical protein
MTLGVVVLGHSPGRYGTITPTVATKIDPDSLVNADGQPAVEAYISVEEWPVRIRVDGGDATAIDGHMYINGEKLTVRGNRALHNLSMIDTSAGESIIRVTILF